MKILSHYPLTLPSKKFLILQLFAKPFPTERKPSECPTKEKKRGKKRKRSGKERKQKVKDERAAKLEIFLSVHTRTSKASLVLDLKTTFWTVSILFG